MDSEFESNSSNTLVLPCDLDGVDGVECVSVCVLLQWQSSGG